jgi:hypothetical protein
MGLCGYTGWSSRGRCRRQAQEAASGAAVGFKRYEPPRVTPGGFPIQKNKIGYNEHKEKATTETTPIPRQQTRSGGSLVVTVLVAVAMSLPRMLQVL